MTRKLLSLFLFTSMISSCTLTPASANEDAKSQGKTAKEVPCLKAEEFGMLMKAMLAKPAFVFADAHRATHIFLVTPFGHVFAVTETNASFCITNVGVTR